MRTVLIAGLLGLLAACGPNPMKRLTPDQQAAAEKVLERSGGNRPQIEAAINRTAKAHLPALVFLLQYMPERDVTTLPADFIVSNVRLACEAFGDAPWSKGVPDSIFLNEVLPYVNLHERRDDWRADFHERFAPVVAGLETPGEAAVRLNEKIWDMVNVHYNTARPKSDQSPYESIEASMASCTGLSILLVDACRAVGVPARFAGIPLWADSSGNHSWVEVWDGDWHVLGAGEPGPLDETWFVERAAQADPFVINHAIWAVSYKPTEEYFPALWDSTVNYVYARNVTHRYRGETLPAGKVRLGISVWDRPGGERVAVDVTLTSEKGVLGRGMTRAGRADLNDLLQFTVDAGSRCGAVIRLNGQLLDRTIDISEKRYQKETWYLTDF